ncbi:hypothetical protein B0A48_00941 [Cryoendolithus antarcticus]|uniref:Uncharacterized protein n=1 Tax=Cryoendolithus antarcticus TaxID=1507870 RepID=A0A1V8TRT0_9PEZI|nr:hypothetical protein B0A48_00941 [Cryoendolithus antarcticus]
MSGWDVGVVQWVLDPRGHNNDHLLYLAHTLVPRRSRTGWAAPSSSRSASAETSFLKERTDDAHLNLRSQTAFENYGEHTFDNVPKKELHAKLDHLQIDSIDWDPDMAKPALQGKVNWKAISDDADELAITSEVTLYGDVDSEGADQRNFDEDHEEEGWSENKKKKKKKDKKAAKSQGKG